MPLQHAALALLSQGATYGYELKRKFEEAIGPQWGELNIGHVYQLLDRLVRDGLVTGKTIEQSDRPNKTVYQLTAAGREELQGWLAQPFERRTGYRDEFFLKLLAASMVGPDMVRDVARRQEASHLSELRVLAEIGHSGDPLVALLVEAATLHTQASLKVAASARAQAHQIAAASETANLADSPAQPAQRTTSSTG